MCPLSNFVLILILIISSLFINYYILSSIFQNNNDPKLLSLHHQNDTNKSNFTNQTAQINTNLVDIETSPLSPSTQEIVNILSSTPNLWGYRQHGEHKLRANDTVFSRITSQREWIIRLSKTDFIQKLKKKKKILVHLDPTDQIFTSLTCRYSPSFEDKCDVVQIRNRGWRSLQKLKIDPHIYKENGVDAVIGIRNGFWGLDDLLSYQEPQLPPGVSQIFYQIESPCHTGSARLGQNGAWLASYWRGSDIPGETFKFIRKKKGDQNYGTIHKKINLFKPSFMKNKKKLVAAMISNCVFYKNNRLGYIDQLKKHIDVDLYGKCGKGLQCPPQNENKNISSHSESEECFKYLGENYKFYLSFENCNCEDYITEKFFMNALSYGMIPIVMGPSKENYEQVAPNLGKSFIHVDDFENPKDLAEYLLSLDKNESLYQEYFDWRKKEEWILSWDGTEDLLCRICGMLYYSDFRPPSPWPSVNTEFINVTKCAKIGSWHWKL